MRAVVAGRPPVLLADVVREMRDCGWRMPGPRAYCEDIARAAGLHVAKLAHGAGAAVYVSDVAFFRVTDGRGKTHDVVSYTSDGRGTYRNDVRPAEVL